MFRELVVAFSIVGICMVLHAAAMVGVTETVLDHPALGGRNPTRLALLLVAVFAIVILLHLSEAAIWAIFYHQKGLFPDFESALYFSLTSYSTIGYGDLLMPQKWRLLGCIEGISGVLLCGVSTAFLFVILNACIQVRAKRAESAEPAGAR